MHKEVVFIYLFRRVTDTTYIFIFYIHTKIATVLIKKKDRGGGGGALEKQK